MKRLLNDYWKLLSFKLSTKTENKLRVSNRSKTFAMQKVLNKKSQKYMSNRLSGQ